MPRLSVTFATLEYPPFVYGGAGMHVKHLTQALSAVSDVEVRTALREGAAETERMGGVLVRRYAFEGTWGAQGGVAKAMDVMGLAMRMASDPVASDLVHVHTWYADMVGVLAKALWKRPFVATVHSLEPLRPWKAEQLGEGYGLSSWMERTALLEADRIVAVSAGMKEDLCRLYPVDPDRVDVIHNGVPLNTFRPRPREEVERVLAGLGVGRPYVLFVGRLSRQKGVLELVRAWGRLRGRRLPEGISLVLLTGPPDTPELTEELRSAIGREEGPPVLWIDRMLPEEETAALYSGAELFVCPSVYEPFGIINLEAMACGRAVVASAVGGIREVVVHGETGWLVPPGDVAALAEAIDAALASRDALAAMGLAGRRRVEERFSWEVIARKTLRTYEKVVRGGEPADGSAPRTRSSVG